MARRSLPPVSPASAEGQHDCSRGSAESQPQPGSCGLPPPSSQALCPSLCSSPDHSPGCVPAVPQPTAPGQLRCPWGLQVGWGRRWGGQCRGEEDAVLNPVGTGP